MLLPVTLVFLVFFSGAETGEVGASMGDGAL